MNPHRHLWENWGRTWLDFWYDVESRNTLAVLRIGVGLVLLYSLLVLSFDLNAHLQAGQWGDLEILRQNDPIAWPYSLFDWVNSLWWIWAVHLLAMLIAAAFTMGLLPNLTGAISALLYISYAHRNPAIVVPLDALLVLALFYLAVSPCGRALAAMPPHPPRRRAYAVRLQEGEPPPSAWGSIVLRTVQIHLCLLYFLSALYSLTPAWLSGAILSQPRFVQWNNPEGLLAGAGGAAWAVTMAHGLTLLGLFYGVFVWMGRFRYPVVALACLVHAVMGFGWGLQSYNALMIVLNLAFVESRHLEWLRQRLEPFLVLPWLPPVGRA